ncbi:hypothetical protein JHK85_010316 [Glycine max]|nr:hypothetical protein JHK85_010316 [Glycine max]KAG5066308.1 hypothetical protein JHK86_010039 [Glycine max]
MNSREVGPVGDFMVRLDERWCGCDKFQKFHMHCSRVVAACKHAHNDWRKFENYLNKISYVAKLHRTLSSSRVEFSRASSYCKLVPSFLESLSHQARDWTRDTVARFKRIGQRVKEPMVLFPSLRR